LAGKKMDEDNIVNSLNELELRAYDIGNEVRVKIKDVLDARFMTFLILGQVFRSLKIYYILRKEYLSHKEWYEEIYVGKWKQKWPVGTKVGMIIDNDDMQRYTEIISKDFDQVMLVAHTQCLFSIMSVFSPLIKQSVVQLKYEFKGHQILKSDEDRLFRDQRDFIYAQCNRCGADVILKKSPINNDEYHIMDY
jgi:hypothetical protein